MKYVYINFNLVFDYNSLLFCTLRSYLLPKGFNIQNSTRNLYELKLPSDAYQAIPKDSINDKCNEADFLALLKENFKAIKPIVGAIDTIQYLNDNGYEVVIYTNLPKEYFQNITESHQKWFAQNKFNHYDDLKQVWEEANFIIDGDRELLQHFSELNKHLEIKKTLIYIKNQQFHIKDKKFEVEGCHNYIKWEDIKWQELIKEHALKEEISFPAPEYFLKLKEAPSSKVMLGFIDNVKLPQKVVCESKVIHGNGKAAKELGIPTANLEVTKEIEQKINHLLTGVYAGIAYLNGTQYQALFFLGSSQYFEDSKKQLECYVYHDFEKDFYDSNIKVEITHFTRPEADFKEFDHLIKVIHCDHAQGKLIQE
ncbi:hypothetical protein ABPG72_009388 [Tetrahymena utriculariae]